MRKSNYILAMILSATVLFTGCMKEDIDELRKQQAENADRIAALEAWQTTVNSNITSLQQLVMALEGKDYVTSVVPFTTPAPGGYRITFTKSGEATIWNGSKGDKGDQGQQGQTGATGRTPAIGVKQFPDNSGVYYWTLDGEFITHDGTPTGNKMPVRGEKGEQGTPGKTAYELAVDNGYTGSLTDWLASLNGTNGVNGKSAYQQAVDNGYTGTEAQWLESLKGASGAAGTNGKSAYELAVENGYTGSLADWLASLNGTNGEDGKSAYQQAADNGYTGTEAQWIESLKGATGQPGTPGTPGADGKTPKVAIGTDGYWYISADGSATGDPSAGDYTGWTKSVKATGENGQDGQDGQDGTTPTIVIGSNGNWVINGTDTGIKATGENGQDGQDGTTPTVVIGPNGNWVINGTDTGVKATGPQGPKGDQGDAIFAGAPVEKADYWEFVLVDGSQIWLPKHKTIGISFTPPGVFAASESKDIPYTSDGTQAPATIKVLGAANGWRVKVAPAADRQSGTIKVTAPATFDAANFLPDITLLLGDADGQAWFKELPAVGDFTGPASNEVGAVYYQKGIPTGIVYIPAGSPGDGRVVSLDEGTGFAYGYYTGTAGATSTTDGLANMKTLYEYGTGKKANDFDNCPAMQWVDPKNPERPTIYNTGDKNKWYLPAKDELKGLYDVWNGGSGTTEVGGQRGIFNGWLTGAGGTSLSTDYYWSSTEAYAQEAWKIGINDGNVSTSHKHNKFRVRAVLAF